MGATSRVKNPHNLAPNSQPNNSETNQNSLHVDNVKPSSKHHLAITDNHLACFQKYEQIGNWH